MYPYRQLFYRTSDGQMDIEFLFLYLGTLGWRAYILSDIDYTEYCEDRSSLYSNTHRLMETDIQRQNDVRGFMFWYGRNKNYLKTVEYICWTVEIHDFDRMREIAATWAEITSYYILHGGSFETIQPRLQARGIIHI